MKKTATIIVLVIFVFSCSRKTVATSASATETNTSVSTTSADDVNTAHAALVEQGKVLYITKCAKCHSAKEVTAYTLTSWEGILKGMIPKAKLTEAESQQVTAYVMEYAKK